MITQEQMQDCLNAALNQVLGANNIIGTQDTMDELIRVFAERVDTLNPDIKYPPVRIR